MIPNHIFRHGTDGNLYYCWFSAMHTRVDIALLGSSDEIFYDAAAHEMASRIDGIERIANCFNPQSELFRYNKGRLEQSSLSPELQHILALCQEWRLLTGGLFDVNYGGEANLSGFIKGYALDEIRLILMRRGITSALVNLGNSSVLALGSQSKDAEGWKVANGNGEEFMLVDSCLTTSGNDSDGRCHIVNPLTGQPVRGRGMVSVVTKGGAEGEVMATVRFITGEGSTVLG